MSTCQLVILTENLRVRTIAWDVKSKLWQFHKQNTVKDSNGASHVTWPTTFAHFREHQINEVLEHCLLFTSEDILKHVLIWHKKYATMVL